MSTGVSLTQFVHADLSNSANQVCDLAECLNPLPHMPILGSSTTAASKDMLSNILTNRDIIF